MWKRRAKNTGGDVSFAGKYQCSKCGWGACEVGEMRVSASFWSSMLDWETQNFTSVTCEKCNYTDFYKGTPRFIDTVMDSMIG